MKPRYEVQLAVHPHWVSRLRFYPDSNRVEKEDNKSTGDYRLIGNKLELNWDDHGAETFSKIGDYFIQDSILDETCPVRLASVPALHALAAVKLGDHFVPLRSVAVEVPGHRYDVSLRVLTSDLPTFHQVFLDREYDSPSLPISASCIVDLGANIGLTSVFFGLKWPSARILAVEPDPSNYDVLKLNVERLGDRIVAKNVAAWSEDGVLGLSTTDSEGRSLGAWGAKTVLPNENTYALVPCRSMPSLIDEFGFDEIDILKVDIEGSELELFSGDLSWLCKIRLLAIETHERFRPGSDLAVRRAVAELFDELPSRGEIAFFRRK